MTKDQLSRAYWRANKWVADYLVWVGEGQWAAALIVLWTVAIIVLGAWLAW